MEKVTRKIRGGKVEVWKDENGNSWSTALYTEEEAIELAKGMVDSRMCHNSENCFGCEWLTGCVGCLRCTHVDNKNGATDLDCWS